MYLYFQQIYIIFVGKMNEQLQIEDSLLRKLSEKGRGRIFFAREFYDVWPDSTVRWALANMARDGKIARLARGVFCFPKLTEHGMRMVLPEPDAIADAIADNTNVRIAPCGDRAAYMVGLTGLSISPTVYLTDGAPRRIFLSNGRRIEFRHTSEMRIFAFRSRKMQLISLAVRALGRDNIREQDRETLKWHLDGISDGEFYADLPLCPEWVRDLLLDLKG